MYTNSKTPRKTTFATEPEMYFADYPSPEQQSNYKFQGAVALTLVIATTVIALVVS
jgi:hypothetical protein